MQQRLWAHQLPSFTLQTQLVRGDGASFWGQLTAIRFPDDGQELGFPQLEDISARKARCRCPAAPVEAAPDRLGGIGLGLRGAAAAGLPALAAAD